MTYRQRDMKWMSENMKTQRVEVKGSKKTSFGIGV